MAQRSIVPIHVALRNQKIDFFFELIGSGRGKRLLDVGGGAGITGEFFRLYERFESVTVLNLEPDISDAPPHLHLDAVRADGCRLPFQAKSVDWIFSNAVIEHVGNWPRQKQFADEIRRVAAKGYFVTTPNRFFPIEPHTLLPFYQFFPVSVQRRLVRFSPGYLTRYEEINLLSAKDLQRLFPEAEVRRMGVPVYANTLVAAYKADCP
jgi:ubiquinone/menaquinone biosynthesis C-methylase UbiE